MKHFKKLVWVGLFINLILLLYVLTQFRVDDMTLAHGDVYEFNEGWEIIREDGSHETIDSLPYLGESDQDEVIVMTCMIPREYWGMTMSFLSADKTLQVSVDGVDIYEFGISDYRSFGHTPGSVINFIDIHILISNISII